MSVSIPPKADIGQPTPLPAARLERPQPVGFFDVRIWFRGLRHLRSFLLLVIAVAACRLRRRRRLTYHRRPALRMEPLGVASVGMREQKNTFDEMRANGGPTSSMVYCADHRCIQWDFPPTNDQTMPGSPTSSRASSVKRVASPVRKYNRISSGRAWAPLPEKRPRAGMSRRGRPPWRRAPGACLSGSVGSTPG